MRYRVFSFWPSRPAGLLLAAVLLWSLTASPGMPSAAAAPGRADETTAAAQAQPPKSEAPAAQESKPSAPKAGVGKKDDDEYEWIERPTPWGMQRFKVPKKKSGSSEVAAPTGSAAAPPAAAPAGSVAAPTAPAPVPHAEPGPGSAAVSPASQNAGLETGAPRSLPAAQAAPAAEPAAPRGTAGQAAPNAGKAETPALQTPGQAGPPPAPPAAAEQPATPGSARISLHLENANLLQVVGIIAAELKMNYIVDPSVKGVVNINTLGDLRQEDLLPLLQSLLQANGATAVQNGSFWRIVPLKEAPRMPIALSKEASGASLPTDDRMIMNVVALRYVSAADMSKILGSYLSEAGHIVTHESGNILLITDTSRSMKRLMDLVALFDTDTLSQQRIRLFPVQNSQAKDLVKDLRDIFAAYALSEKNAAVRFVPIERINSILVVTGNPAVYPQVEQWLEKLDKAVRKTGIQNFVYKVENGTAENLAGVLSNLYGGGSGRSISRPAGTFGSSLGASGMGQTGQTTTNTVNSTALPPPPQGVTPTTGTPGEVGEVALGTAGGVLQSPVRIVPDVINNVLIIQATAQDYEAIRQTLKELDIVPRQVMIEAKVYEVTLTGALSFGVEAFLEQRSAAQRKPLAQFATEVAGVFPSPGLSGSVGTLVGRTRELMLFLNAQENRTRTRVISAPTILASDNVDARIQVGNQIPILSSQGVVPGAQAGGTSLFTNTIQQQDTGVILSVLPRINSSGLVTMRIQQEVSQPEAPTTGAIQSPSIQKRTVVTQVTVQNGETISLGGIIQEHRLTSTNRIPLLGDIPWLGALFGSTTYSTDKTELIVLLTPHVLQDLNDAQEATEEFKAKLKDLRKVLRQKGD